MNEQLGSSVHGFFFSLSLSSFGERERVGAWFPQTETNQWGDAMCQFGLFFFFHKVFCFLLMVTLCIVFDERNNRIIYLNLFVEINFHFSKNK